jgi:hypothetical protein
VERLLRENEELRRKVAEREKQIADAEKQIADLERQLALRKRNSTNSSTPLPQTAWRASRDRAAASTRASGNRAHNPDTRGIIED